MHLRATSPLRARIAAAAILLSLSFCLASAPRAQEVPQEIQEYTLDNGMRVLLWPVDGIPNLSVYTFWHVGSRNEAPGITGLAHFFEHMMFNGSRNYLPGEFDRTMEAAGGANNAYTSRNVTVYQDWVPASALELTLDLEADRIGGLSVDPEVVSSERGVVMSERRRSVEDSNMSLMLEQLWSAAYIAHPYQWPVIGWRSDIENWRQVDVEEFHARWYAPNNASMVIVGSFDPDLLLPLLEEKLGSIPARELGRDVVTVEPEQRGERRVELRKEASLASVVAAYHIPETSSEDFAALELLDLILTEGESSRLYRRLVDEDQSALWLWGSIGESFDPGLYMLMMQVREDVESAAVEAALYEELERIKLEGVDERELAKAKNILLANFYREMATISGMAQALGSYELFHGGWANLFTAEEKYARVTVEDLQRVADTYFRPENRTVVTLIPTPGGSDDES